MNKICALQGENQVGVLHVQPHVRGNSEGESDEAGSGFLCAGGLVVHEANEVRQRADLDPSLTVTPSFSGGKCCHFIFFFLVFNSHRPGCSMPEIWDVEDPQNVGKVPLCTHMSRNSRPHFTPVFSNDIYKVLKVPKAPKDLR